MHTQKLLTKDIYLYVESLTELSGKGIYIIDKLIYKWNVGYSFFFFLDTLDFESSLVIFEK